MSKKYIFSESDYNSGDGMMTSVWGPPMWHVLHTISFNYPIKPTDNDKDNIKKFLECLQYVLPCGICRKNYKMELEQRPIRLNSRKELVYWLFEIHNDVNSRTGKRLYTFEEAVNEYEKKRKTNRQTKQTLAGKLFYSSLSIYLYFSITISVSISSTSS